MTTAEIVTTVLRALEETGLPYMVVGSFSTNYYGIVRSTQDLDLIVELCGDSLAELAKHLGPEFWIDPQTSFETATFSIRNIITVKESPFKVELFHRKEDEHDQERFRRRVRAVLKEGPAYLPTAEDVIITKLRWLLQLNRDKDRADVKGVIGQQYKALDWSYIESWCDKHGTRQLLDEIRKSVTGI